MDQAERKQKVREARREGRQNLNQMRRWWISRMVESPRPLEEKLTLFWHGHFATSNRKVKSTYCMYRQNQTFRTHAAGNWRTLLIAASKEPAMLIYLDNGKSRRQSPNENFARELMELFTLGEGHYTEADIREAARALTGWSLDRKRFVFRFRPGMHDGGIKTFMGKEGRLKGEDIIDAILSRKQASLYISRKLWEFFAYLDPEPEIVDGLAAVLRENNFEFRPVLRTMFKSSAFYSEKAVRTQVKSPVQWLVSTIKAGALDVPPPFLVSRGLAALGQDLFNPPNVKGWDGGLTWISASSLVQRYSFTGNLVHGRFNRKRMRELDFVQGGANAREILPESRRDTVRDAMEHLMWRVYQGQIRDEDAKALKEYAAGRDMPGTWTDRRVREVVQFMMSTPAYQVT